MQTYLHLIDLAFVPILAYIIRLERKLAKLTTDICWIKKKLQDPEH